MKLTERQRRFVEAYIETGNATEAARRAGYSEKTARVTGQENLLKPAIQQAIDSRMKEIEKLKTATPEEIMQHLTAAMRGQIREEVVVSELNGDGGSETKIVKKQISARDRLKAAELLLKRYPLKLDVEEQRLRNEKLKAEVSAMQDTGSEEAIQIIDDLGGDGHAD
ncbi:terminase small subunit [uncultured Megasphaera sp.]|uniref:terminase small subunit n=1 Tax=uncultured Megasphaera sp. TaxID=165188 RepID=UPI00265916EB|nr:terminase small subunit [uncultured Megasphaera sp.]